MIRLAEVADAFLPDLEARYGDRLLPGQRNALSAILRCRTEACGTAAIHCHDCEHADSFPLSCGHRLCPRCQHHENRVWLERQRKKLLPLSYFLVTFTLPAELRPIARAFPKLVKPLGTAAVLKKQSQIGVCRWIYKYSWGKGLWM